MANCELCTVSKELDLKDVLPAALTKAQVKKKRELAGIILNTKTLKIKKVNNSEMASRDPTSGQPARHTTALECWGKVCGGGSWS